MRHKFGLRIALTLRPAGPAHPLFDNLELNTFSSRTLQIPLSNPFRLIPLRTLPFCVYSVLHSKFFAFNRLRTLSQNTGVGINSSQSGTLAPSPTNHKSQVTNHE